MVVAGAGNDIELLLAGQVDELDGIARDADEWSFERRWRLSHHGRCLESGPHGVATIWQFLHGNLAAGNLPDSVSNAMPA